MSNSASSNPIILDTWSSDITISSAPVIVRKIRLFSAAAGDKFYLEDKYGTQVFYMVQATNARVTEVNFNDGFRFDGLQVDVSDCTGLGTSDIAWIYLK